MAIATATRRRSKAVDDRVLIKARGVLEDNCFERARVLLPDGTAEADLQFLARELRRLDLKKAGIISGISRRQRAQQHNVEACVPSMKEAQVLDRTGASKEAHDEQTIAPSTEQR